jgi:hypothetical protein
VVFVACKGRRRGKGRASVWGRAVDVISTWQICKVADGVGVIGGAADAAAGL